MASLLTHYGVGIRCYLLAILEASDDLHLAILMTPKSYLTQLIATLVMNIEG